MINNQIINLSKKHSIPSEDKSPISKGSSDHRKSVAWNKLNDANLVESRKELFGRRQTLFAGKMNIKE